MTGVESILRRLFEGRTRRWSVITIIAVLLLALGLPAVDEYFALRRQEAELASQLEQAELQLQGASDLRQRASQVSVQLGEMEARGLHEENAQTYRQSVVQLIRESGCQFRKLHMENPTLRDWVNDDNPLSRPKKQTGRRKIENATAYQLRAQTVSLSVTGSLNETRDFLQRLQADGKLMHTTRLSIRPMGRDRYHVVTELEFTLFGLERSKHTDSSA